jgi:Ca2+-binding EF-hand superfamily protein
MTSFRNLFSKGESMKLKFSAAVLAVAVAGFAQAQTETAPAERKARTEKLDVNGDGLISREEAAKAPRLVKQFDAIDTNKDGLLSREEFAAWRKSHGKSSKGESAQPGA